MDDRRTTPRRRTLYRGTLSYSEGRIKQPCVVRDASSGGLRLQLDSEGPVPQRFELTVPQLDLHNRAVEIRWARGRDIGVAFADAVTILGPPETAPGASESMADRVARLEVEIGRLHRQLQDLRGDIKRYRNEE